MKFCAHCGKELSDALTICPGCGCETGDKKTLVIYRERQFFLYNPAINLEIRGGKFNGSYSIENDQTITCRLPSGHYELIFSHKKHRAVCKVDLFADANYRVGWDRFNGGIRAWAVKKT